jgi:hypothetical protein
LKKTKVVVLKKAFKLASSEKWFFKGKNIDVVAWYRYLGIISSNSLSTSRAINSLADQGKR